jgi:beta-galactosidase
MERDVIREYCSHVPITTNLMGTCKPTNYHEWAKEMDIVSWDSYPPRGANPADIAFQHSLMRGLKEGQSWMLMEQTPSQQNWQAYNSLKRPGVMRLWSFQAIAHGADAVMYFQWRRSRGCCEKFHGAVVEHAGRTDARVFQEVKSLGQELAALGTQTIGARVRSKVALLFDWENWWALDYSVGPSVDLKFVSQVKSFYSALHSSGIIADIVTSEADLSGYSIVIAPVLYMVKPGVDQRIKDFVSAGGKFVTTYFSGIVDETDIVFEGGYPGPLRDLLGIWVEETDVLSPQESNSVLFAEDSPILAGKEEPCGLLCERIHNELGARTLATYVSDFYANEPAITVNSYGEGSAYYLGTQLSESGLAGTLISIAATCGIKTLAKNHPGSALEVVERVTEDGAVLTFALNHGETALIFQLENDAKHIDLLTGSIHEGAIELTKYGVAILKPV